MLYSKYEQCKDSRNTTFQHQLTMQSILAPSCQAGTQVSFLSPSTAGYEGLQNQTFFPEQFITVGIANETSVCSVIYGIKGAKRITNAMDQGPWENNHISVYHHVNSPTPHWNNYHWDTWGISHVRQLEKIFQQGIHTTFTDCFALPNGVHHLAKLQESLPLALLVPKCTQYNQALYNPTFHLASASINVKCQCITLKSCQNDTVVLCIHFIGKP